MHGHFSDAIWPKQEFTHFKNYQNRSKCNKNMEKWAEITIFVYFMRVNYADWVLSIRFDVETCVDIFQMLYDLSRSLLISKIIKNRSKCNKNMEKWAGITILDYFLNTDHIKAVNLHFWSIFNDFKRRNLNIIVVLAKYEG